MADQHLIPRQRPHFEPDELSRLWRACDSTNTDLIAKLVRDQNLDVDDFKIPLRHAIQNGNLTVARFLLRQGARAGGDEVTSALRAGSISALEMLREHGWHDVNMDLGEGDGSAYTALNLAANNSDLVRYLLELGANPNLGPACSGNIGTVLNNVLIPDSGHSLRVAARCGCVESLNLLLVYGGDPAKAQLLHAAVKGGSIPMMVRVLEIGADIDESDCVLKNGLPTYRTPLLRAIGTKDAEAVQFLLERGADVKIPGNHGWTPLQIVRKECCGGRSLCIVHGLEISSEIRDLIEAAVEKEASRNANETYGISKKERERSRGNEWTSHL